MSKDLEFEVGRSDTDLRLRITEDLGDDQKRRVEVLDMNNNVLGDLAKSVSGVRWEMGIQGGFGIVTIDVAVERAKIESIEVRGHNVN